VLLVPAVQTLFSQQPPLQSWVGPQALVHLLVEASQAKPVGQSLALLHPQALLTQADPSACPTQLTQFPGVPQLVEVLAQTAASCTTVWSGVDVSGWVVSVWGVVSVWVVVSVWGASTAASTPASGVWGPSSATPSGSVPVSSLVSMSGLTNESHWTVESSEQAPRTRSRTEIKPTPRRMTISFTMSGKSKR
jgi:hypothetical protein